jgi:spore coat protein U-like protein
MNTSKKFSLFAAAVVAAAFGGSATAVTVGGTLTVDATLTAACEVSPTSQIQFGSFDALASTGNKDANSGSSFQVACTTGLSPTIYASASRVMSNGTDSLPFNLSLTSGGSDDLASAAIGAQAVSITQDGTMQDVVLYGRVLASNFASLPAGAYTGDVTVSVVY